MALSSAAVPGDPPVRIDGLRRTVADLARSIDFYCGAFSFERPGAGPPSTTVRLRLGAQHIDLVLRTPAGPPPAHAPDPRFQHAAIVTGDMDAAWRQLAPYRVAEISRGGPQVLPAHTGGVTAFKFRDPDGHPLELIRFPAGVGDPCWQAAGAGGPTLGIDHFAIVVADLPRSTSFFAARLGLLVAHRDLNFGATQDRLDGLDGAQVDVVSLVPRRGPGTPHLELLHYRQPSVASSDDADRFDDDGRDEIVLLGAAGTSPAAQHLRDPDGHRFRVEAGG